MPLPKKRGPERLVQAVECAFEPTEGAPPRQRLPLLDVHHEAVLPPLEVLPEQGDQNTDHAHVLPPTVVERAPQLPPREVRQRYRPQLGLVPEDGTSAPFVVQRLQLALLPLP